MVPPRKVLGLEVVPLNRINWLSTLVPLKELAPPTEKMTKYTGPTQDTKNYRVFPSTNKTEIFINPDYNLSNT